MTFADRCTMPLGLEDRRILSGSLRASSSYNYNHGPDRARLNIYASHGRTGAWVARHRNAKQWLQIDLGGMSVVKGIATQGRRGANQWVSSYTLSYGRYGNRFKTYAVGGRYKVQFYGLRLLIPVHTTPKTVLRTFLKQSRYRSMSVWTAKVFSEPFQLRTVKDMFSERFWAWIRSWITTFFCVWTQLSPGTVPVKCEEMTSIT